jgi:hypothetical protein
METVDSLPELHKTSSMLGTLYHMGGLDFVVTRCTHQNKYKDYKNNT